ncbi:hypothetical protein IP70_06280 [alpha proteobacterium AAP38]|nr:hypothetical protein IP70_06280 [alpha proteobacterium AAP38]
MSFREKLAWTQLLVLLAFGAAYFGPVFGSYLGWAAVPGGGQFMWMVACIIGLIVGQVVLAVALAIVTAIRTPAEARSPKDERDRQVGLLGTRTGFYVLVTGIICAMLSLHHGADKVMLVNFIFFALLLAELSRLGTQVFMYRRGW